MSGLSNRNGPSHFASHACTQQDIIQSSYVTFAFISVEEYKVTVGQGYSQGNQRKHSLECVSWQRSELVST